MNEIHILILYIMPAESKQMTKKPAEKHRKINPAAAAVTVLIVLLACSLAAGSAAAGEITVKAPASPAAAGDTITLPVIMTGAEDIAGITFEIANNVPGVTITISSSRPLEDGVYSVNSAPENSVQKLVWFSSFGETGNSLELFSLDVVVSPSAAASVPIVITPVTIVNSKSGFLTDMYPVTSANIQLTDKTVGVVTMNAAASQPLPTQTAPTQAVPSAAPTQTASQPQKTETPAPADDIVMKAESTPEGTSAVSGTPQAQPVHSADSKTASAASPLGLLPLIGAAAAAFIIGRKERIL